MTGHAIEQRESPIAGSRSRVFELAFAGGVSVAVLLPLLLFGPVDLEQYHHSWPATRVLHKALFSGQSPFWSNAFGLGTPLPLGENLAFHPFFMVEPLIELRWAFRAFWLVHLAAGVYFIGRIARLFRMEPLVSRLIAIAYALSIPTINYAYTDDWPSVFLGWSLLPIVVYCIARITLAPSGRGTVRPALGLTLVLWFALCNSHWGYLLIAAGPMCLYGIILARGRQRSLLLLSGVVALAALLAGERLYFFYSEWQLLDPSHQMASQAPAAWSAWATELYRPASLEGIRALFDKGATSTWAGYIGAKPPVRVPFMGGLLFLAAAAGFWRSFRPEALTRMHRVRQAVGWSFVASIVVSTLPGTMFAGLPSGMWVYRDHAILFGLLGAGCLISETRRIGGAARRWTDRAMLLQFAQIALVVAPGLWYPASHQQDNVRFYAGPSAGTFATWVREQTGGTSGRVYLSPAVTNQLLSERRIHAEIGLLATGDLEPLGLFPVNGYFKNVWMGALHPPIARMTSVIGSQRALLESRSSLDILSIDYVLAFKREGLDERAGLTRLGDSMRTPNNEEFVLYLNEDAWPDAQLYPPSIRELSFEQLPGCNAPGLMCRDLQPLAALRASGRLDVQVESDSFHVQLDRSEKERLLLLPYLYRPEWKATDQDGRRLTTESLLGGLIAVGLPGGVSEVHVEYSPVPRVVLAVAGTVIIVFIAVIFVCAPSQKG